MPRQSHQNGVPQPTPTQPTHPAVTLPQGIGPHVEINENGVIRFVRRGAIDEQGNNLDRMRIVLPQLVELADQLLRSLSRINDPDNLLLRCVNAYRDQLDPNPAQIDISRILFEGHYLANTVSSINAEIAAGNMRRPDTETNATLTTLQDRQHFFAMGTAEGLKMLTEEARFRREPAEENECQKYPDQ